MNLQNAAKFIEQLERLPDEKFDMQDYVQHDTPCGTVACGAGWCCLLNGGPTNSHYHFEFAQKFLGLEYHDATYLFMGRWGPKQVPTGYGPTPKTRQEFIDEVKRMVHEDDLASTS